MSSASSPTRRGTNNGFDGTSYYDPDFTVEISNRMRVPDKISLLPEGMNHTDRNGYPKTSESNEWMRVPERILVAGGDKYAAGRPAPPEMKLESSIHGENFNNEHVQLMTPPRHLTLNEHSYPTVEPENDLNLSDSELKSSNRSHAKTINFSPQDINYGSPTQDTFGNSFLNSNTSMTAEGELGQLKRNVKLLSRKVNALERETAQRYQRDVLVYTLGIIYFVFKGFSWLNRRW